MRLTVTIVVLAALLVCANAGLHEDVEYFAKLGYEVAQNEWGQHLISKETSAQTDTIVYAQSLKSLTNLPSLYEKFLERVLNFKQEDADQVLLKCSKGKKADFWRFAAVDVGVLGTTKMNSERIILGHHEDDCFGEVEATFEVLSDTSAQVTFTPKNAKPQPNGAICKDTFVVATTTNVNTMVLSEAKPHVMTFKGLTQIQMDAMRKFGLRVFRTCDSYAHLLPDVLLTVGLFLGGFGLDPEVPFFGSKPTILQEMLNVDFIKRGTGFHWRRRFTGDVELDETEVHSGDFVSITRMDGVDQIIQWGAGSVSGHSVVLLEMDGQMYAIESQDGWYWPKHGIQKNLWADWKVWAKNAGFNVAILPMKEEVRNKFNIEKATEFFKSVEGLPYGYHNFVFGWLDDPAKNLPPITTLDFLYVVFCMLERIVPDVTNSFMAEGLNKRLGTVGLTLPEIANKAADQGMSIEQLFAIVERDEWVYSDGKSMVCSAFVAAIYKAGGLFEGLEVEATEFSPRDVYQLNFFDLDYKRPLKCVLADPDLPYCQIMGKYKMDTWKDGYSTKAPYNKMFQHCPSQAPDYARPADC